MGEDGHSQRVHDLVPDGGRRPRLDDAEQARDRSDRDHADCGPHPKVGVPVGEDVVDDSLDQEELRQADDGRHDDEDGHQGQRTGMRTEESFTRRWPTGDFSSLRGSLGSTFVAFSGRPMKPALMFLPLMHGDAARTSASRGTSVM